MTWRRALLALALAGCADIGEPADDAESTMNPSESEHLTAASSPPTLAIESGIPVKGAGPSQQWEGVVMTMRPVGNNQASTCSATFITERHLLTAAHCYDQDGPQRVSARAPTWNNNAWQHFDNAVVKRASAGPDFRIDIAVVDLGQPQAWATPERRFRLFAGRPTPTDLHIYGYGARSENVPDINGTLRTPPGRATVRVTDAGNGYLVAPGTVARVCAGDSGGPAIKEGSMPVQWGVNRSFSSSILRSIFDPRRVCPSFGATMSFTNISANLAFVERSLGRTCTRVDVDGQPAAQCW